MDPMVADASGDDRQSCHRSYQPADRLSSSAVQAAEHFGQQVRRTALRGTPPDAGGPHSVVGPDPVLGYAEELKHV